MARIEEGAPDIQMRVFSSERNADFMQEYLKEEKWAAVPVFAFFDADFSELAHWHERPAPADAEIDRLRQKMSGQPENEIEAEIVRLIGRNLKEWQQETVRELRELLS